MAQKYRAMKLVDILLPNRAIIVMATEIDVTKPGPNFFVSRSELSEETTVPQETIMKMMPDQDKGTLKSLYMIGQALPRRESGRPREMNAI